MIHSESSLFRREAIFSFESGEVPMTPTMLKIVYHIAILREDEQCVCLGYGNGYLVTWDECLAYCAMNRIAMGVWIKKIHLVPIVTC